MERSGEVAVKRQATWGNVGYTLKRAALDTDPAARQPQDQQIVLLNRDLSDRSDLNLPSREGTPSASACD